jgi:hypothetical protein
MSDLHHEVLNARNGGYWAAYQGNRQVYDHNKMISHCTLAVLDRLDQRFVVEAVVEPLSPVFSMSARSTA